MVGWKVTVLPLNLYHHIGLDYYNLNGTAGMGIVLIKLNPIPLLNPSLTGGHIRTIYIYCYYDNLCL